MNQIVLPLFYDYVFPNYVLPNAIPTELGMVNYLHSLHSNRLSGHTFFDQNDSIKNYQNILTYMFEKSFGDWSSSWGGSPHLVSGPLLWYVDCREESVFLGKKKFNKYVYPVRITPHFDDFTGVADIGSRLNGEYFWKFISKEVLNDVMQGNAIIFLDYSLENFVERSTYVKLHEGLAKSGIPKEQIILAYNSFNAQENYEAWFPEEERHLLVRNFPFLMINSSYSYTVHPEKVVDLDIFQGSRSRIRNNYFVFKNRRPRSHRKAILYQLFCSNLLEKGDWSWVSDEKISNNDIDYFESTYQMALDRSRIAELSGLLPHCLQHEPYATFETAGAWQHRDRDTYQNAYFEICTETYTNSGHKSLTEKVFSPLINFQPFFFVAFPGALELLQQQGFRTFHPFINESYDKELDTGIRIKMIYEEIQRLCAMSKEDIHNWYWGMEEVLIHNHQHLKSIYKTEQNSMNLVKYLNSRIKG
jgi:hypothetical protein